MWHRNDAQPVKYRDVLFRSALEARVAEELDKLSVDWAYECPVHEGMDGVCWLDGREMPAADLVIYPAGDGRWVGVCRGHIDDQSGGRP